MPGALTGALRTLGPLATVGCPSAAPALVRTAMIVLTASVPVLMMAAPASVAAVSVPASFSGPLATSAPLGRPTPVPGFAPATVVSPAITPVSAGAAVIMASTAASGANGGEPIDRPLLADVPRQADEGIAWSGALQR